jgi:hypothetical protein
MNAKALSALLFAGFSPSQHVVHKPTRSGNGNALRLQLRLEPQWVETEGGGGYFDRTASKQGGMFLDLAGQQMNGSAPALDAGGNPTFNWEQGELYTAKLGMADMTGLLVAIREWRAGRNVPTYLRGKNADKTNLVTLFHKNPKGGSTIITYEMTDETAILQISKGKDARRSIALTMGEELVLVRYLEMAVDAYIRIGRK